MAGGEDGDLSRAEEGGGASSLIGARGWEEEGL
jgi:hypothetical protein